MPTAYTTRYSQQMLMPAYDHDLARERSVAIAASKTIPRGTLLGEIGGINATSTITVSAGTSAGTFKLTALALQTAAISWNATNATLLANIQAALDTTFGTTGGSHNVVPSAVSLTAGIGTILLTCQNALGGQPVTWTLQDSTTGGTGTTIASTTTGVADAGTMTPYSSTATDGSQVPKCVAKYDMITDASGNITFSTTAGVAGGPQGETSLTAPVFVSGCFKTTDLVGLDTNALTVMGARLESGVVGNGIVRIP